MDGNDDSANADITNNSMSLSSKKKVVPAAKDDSQKESVNNNKALAVAASNPFLAALMRSVKSIKEIPEDHTHLESRNE